MRMRIKLSERGLGLMGGFFAINVVIISVFLQNHVFGSSLAPQFDSSSSLDVKYSQGKETMDKLYAMSRLPRIGDCWKSALEGMETACKDLDQETQSRLALRFTSCYNEMTFLPPVLCGPTDPLQGCYKALGADGMNTFRDFFLQTQNICFFLQSEVWREENDRLINRLTQAASNVQEQMLKTKEKQEEILEATSNVQHKMQKTEQKQEKILASQEQSEKMQSGLLKDQHALYNVVVRFKDIFDDFRVSVEDHRLIFAEIFEKLTRTQKLVSWIQGEMSLLDMMGFYFISLIFGFIASATPRTRRARFWLICLTIISLISERYVYGWMEQSDKNFAPEQIQEWIWFLRRTAAACGVFILIWAAARFRDYQAMNNNMLAEMHARIEILMEFVSELSRTGVRVPHEILSETKEPLVCEDDEGKPQISEAEADITGDDDASEISSTNTYSNYTNDSDTENLSQELADISEDINGGESVTVEVAKKVPLFERFFGSSRIQNENPSTGDTSATPTSPNSHGYNLRERKTTPLRDNAVLAYEGPTMFANTIKKTRKRNQTKFDTERRSQHCSYFSSDDEF